MGVIHHSAICVRDIDASLRFWRDGLGFEVLMDGSFEGDWPTLLRAPSTELRSVFLGDPAHPDAGVVEISGAGTSRRWLTRKTLRTMFAVPFEEWGCQAVVMRVSDHDDALHRMLRSYGFEKYRIPRLRGRDEAENVFLLTDAAWAANKFNRKKSHGQAEGPKAA